MRIPRAALLASFAASWMLNIALAETPVEVVSENPSSEVSSTSYFDESDDESPEYEVANRNLSMEEYAADGAAADPAKPAPPKPKKPKKPPQPWKPVFYDNDFSYLNDPQHTPLLGECLKRNCFGPGELSYGGELRYRYMADDNRFRPAPGQYPAQNDYSLWRLRQYLNYDLGDARLYIEGLDAQYVGGSLPPLAIDKDRWDLLNAFVDVRTPLLTENSFFRTGRQELLYGSQRLVSPLDWANTRRTFEGMKWYNRGKCWDFDVFAVRPVTVNPIAFDGELGTRTFCGAWLTNHEDPDHTFDYYWLYNHDNGTNARRTNGFSRHTLGARWLGKDPCKNSAGDEICALLWDFEGGYQFGDDSGQTVSAGFVTTGIGHQWTAQKWKPALWGYFDYASGDAVANDGKNNTFQQLYPLGHLYLGWFDGVGRQNILDYNFKGTVNPTKKLELTAWMHYFFLASPRDALYNAAGQVFATNPANSNRTFVGDELDLLATYNYNQNLSFLTGYSWFWSGSFLHQASTPRLGDGEFLYTQAQLRF